MVFPYAFAQALNNLNLSETKKWFDVDYFQLASITERGIDSCLMNGFLTEGYIVEDKNGNEIDHFNVLTTPSIALKFRAWYIHFLDFVGVSFIPTK